MANNILTARDCPHNAEPKITWLYQDTSLLAELFKLCYEEYDKRLQLERQAFVGALRLLIEDHIDPICQQNPNCPAAYPIYRDQFIHYVNSDFQQDSSSLNSLTLSIAHLVRCAVDSFCFFDYPKAYLPFLELLEDIFNNDTLIQHRQYRKAYILLEQLRQKP